METQRNSYDYQVQRALKRKLYLIGLRGDECESCGYNKNLAALDFHHIDPTQKETKLDSRHLSNSTLKNILKEFEKCKVLCANCHREHHYPNMMLDEVKLRVKEFDDAPLKLFNTSTTLCIDCNSEITKGYIRCTSCNNLFKRKVKNRPSVEQLHQERKEIGVDATAKKYGVTTKTIRRWIK